MSTTTVEFSFPTLKLEAKDKKELELLRQDWLDEYKEYDSQLMALENRGKKSWEPPPKLKPWEWADQNIYLSDRVSPYPGRYKSAKTPYVREPMEAYTDNKIHFIVLMWAAQSAKTLTETLLMLYNMANDPGNQIFMFPNTTMAQSFSETRLQPMIDDNPCLKELKPLDRHKFKNLEMQMKTGTLNLVGGNSPINLASRNAGKLFTDEVDKLRELLSKEADPLSLLFERAKWFWDYKAFITSTVTTEDNHIYQWYMQGTQEEYHIHCPGCEKPFYPKWKDVVWSEDETLKLRDIIKTARIKCPHCEYLINETQKKKLLQDGVWIAKNDDAPEDIRSFHYTEILSPITALPDLVLKFLKAQQRAKVGDIGPLKNFVNSSLCEPWKDELGREKTEEEIDRLMVADKEGLVPDYTKGVFAGIDTQDNGFYFTVRAFGEEYSSRLLHYGFASDFKNLEDQIFNVEWSDRHGGKWSVEHAFIDAGGHRTTEVHDWCRRMGGIVQPAMARDHARLTSMYSYSVVDKTAKGKPKKRGLKQLIWSSAAVKDIIAWKMTILPGHPGSFEIPNTVTRDYKAQIRSEYKDDKGYWVQINSRANHYWDCEALGFISAMTRNVSNRATLKDQISYLDKIKEENESINQERPKLWG